MNARTPQQFSGTSKDERELATLVALASGMGLGALLGLSEALRVNQNGASLRFSFRTAIAFTVGFAAAFGYLNRTLRNSERTSKLFSRIGLALLLTLVGAAFGYPLRLFAIRTLVEKLVGVLVALCFISAGLTMIHAFVRSAEREEAEQESKEHTGTASRAP